MDLQSKINIVRSRIKQIRDSDLFSETEKEQLIKTNNSELDMYQSELAKQRIESAKITKEAALAFASSLNVETKKASI
ncbi:MULTISPECIES: hypothetical protein [Flavobacteriaceae]|uniref:hypothetical protein n=1 Tax=Flavobacteriaceae TaxID=49546 RepID=UPI003A919E24